MDLKDLVISTLAEIDEAVRDESNTEKPAKPAPFVIEEYQEPKRVELSYPKEEPQRQFYAIAEEESKPAETKNDAKFENFLVNLKERILVLFEGLQTIDSSGNKELLMIEKKMDLTVNFLEYLLASIDEKLENPTR